VVRENRVKITSQTLTGVSDADYDTGTDYVNGEIEKVVVTGAGIEYDLDITPTINSGLTTGFQILNVQATGNAAYYPRMNVQEVDGTAAAAGDNLWGKPVVASTLDYNASVLATGSSITVKVYYR
jgi:hypothetical protein